MSFFFNWFGYFNYLFFRNGVLGAKYLPTKIVFDRKTKRLQPEPLKNATWIRVCGKEDNSAKKIARFHDKEENA